MSASKDSVQILELIGGKDNIVSITHSLCNKT